MIGQTLQYGPDRIPYRVTYVPAMNGKLAIHVLPSGLVRVDAPLNTSLAEIKRGVGKRARWIDAHLAKIRERSAVVAPREYVSGESHFYLGRRYLLKVRLKPKEVPSVRLLRGRFEIVTNKPGGETVGSMMWDWYRIRARVIFAERLEVAAARLTWLHKLPQWKMLTMKRQWGSCSPGGILSLNPHLVKAPPACVDYVLLHELCHLKHHNHSGQFYRTLSLHMPEWQSVKQRLDEMADRLLLA